MGRRGTGSRSSVRPDRGPSGTPKSPASPRRLNRRWRCGRDRHQWSVRAGRPTRLPHSNREGPQGMDARVQADTRRQQPRSLIALQDRACWHHRGQCCRSQSRHRGNEGQPEAVAARRPGRTSECSSASGPARSDPRSRNCGYRSGRPRPSRSAHSRPAEAGQFAA